MINAQDAGCNFAARIRSAASILQSHGASQLRGGSSGAPSAPRTRGPGRQAGFQLGPARGTANIRAISSGGFRPMVWPLVTPPSITTRLLRSCAALQHTGICRVRRGMTDGERQHRCATRRKGKKEKRQQLGGDGLADVRMRVPPGRRKTSPGRALAAPPPAPTVPLPVAPSSGRAPNQRWQLLRL